MIRIEDVAGVATIQEDAFDSPGGWHLIGVVGATMLRDGGALLRLGDRVRFVREGA